METCWLQPQVDQLAEKSLFFLLYLTDWKDKDNKKKNQFE